MKCTSSKMDSFLGARAELPLLLSLIFAIGMFIPGEARAEESPQAAGTSTSSTKEANQPAEPQASSVQKADLAELQAQWLRTLAELQELRFQGMASPEKLAELAERLRQIRAQMIAAQPWARVPVPGGGICPWTGMRAGAGTGAMWLRGGARWGGWGVGSAAPPGPGGRRAGRYGVYGGVGPRGRGPGGAPGFGLGPQGPGFGFIDENRNGICDRFEQQR